MVHICPKCKMEFDGRNPEDRVDIDFMEDDRNLQRHCIACVTEESKEIYEPNTN